MFSIVIPLYNKEDTIARTIESVLFQTFDDFELIIVDDGSTDASLSIVQSFDDRRIVVHSKINEGVSVARNFGVSHATYSFIAFLDADDIWEADYLESMQKVIVKYSDAQLYGSSFKIKQDERYIVPRIGIESNFEQGYIDYINTLADNLNCSCYHTSAVIVRKDSFLQLGGFVPGIKSGEDILLWILFAVTGKTVYLNKPLCIYNFDANPSHRAITKSFKPSEFYIFHFEKLAKFEKENSQLRSLLDKLRLKNLKRFYASGKYSALIGNQLNQVSRENYSIHHKVFYSLPSYIINPFLRSFVKMRFYLSKKY